MRMHRGSSNGSEADPGAPESLPLSATSAKLVHVEFEVGSADRSVVRSIDVPRRTLLRSALRAAGLAPEGCAVLRGQQPLPLDVPLERAERLVVISAFSGG